MGDIDTATGLYCIFGDPVAHSLSPAMQNAAFRETGINAVYLAFRPASLTGALEAMRSLPVRGASVTIPYKSEIIGLLDEVDPLAADIGAVNTLLNRDGRITGYNTDGSGALEALRLSGAHIPGSKTLVLGNGGSARAIAFTLIAEGGRVIIAGRNPKRYLPLVEELRRRDPGTEAAALGELSTRGMEEVDIVINTTSVGMAPDTAAMPISGELLLPRHTVFDIVYAPHVTALIAAARERGCAVVYGRDMLLHQGARQFEIWTGRRAPVDAMSAALDKAMGAR